MHLQEEVTRVCPSVTPHVSSSGLNEIGLGPHMQLSLEFCFDIPLIRPQKTLYLKPQIELLSGQQKLDHIIQR